MSLLAASASPPEAARGSRPPRAAPAVGPMALGRAGASAGAPRRARADVALSGNNDALLSRVALRGVTPRSHFAAAASPGPLGGSTRRVRLPKPACFGRRGARSCCAARRVSLRALGGCRHAVPHARLLPAARGAAGCAWAGRWRRRYAGRRAAAARRRARRRGPRRRRRARGGAGCGRAARQGCHRQCFGQPGRAAAVSAAAARGADVGRGACRQPAGLRRLRVRCGKARRQSVALFAQGCRRPVLTAAYAAPAAQVQALPPPRAPRGAVLQGRGAWRSRLAPTRRCQLACGGAVSDAPACPTRLCPRAQAFWCRHCHNECKNGPECGDGDAKRCAPAAWRARLRPHTAAPRRSTPHRSASRAARAPSWHELDRKCVSDVQCALCHTVQPVAEACLACGTAFGRYTCLECRFFDDDVRKGQFHCDKCGICRVGGRDNFFHVRCPFDAWRVARLWSRAAWRLAPLLTRLPLRAAVRHVWLLLQRHHQARAQGAFESSA